MLELQPFVEKMSLKIVFDGSGTACYDDGEFVECACSCAAKVMRNDSYADLL